MIEKILKPPVKYYLYCRKSTDSEKDQINSLPAQEAELLDVVRQESLTVIGTFKESKSAHHGCRPQFNKMMDNIEKGKANAFIVWSLNRISRNSHDSARVIGLMEAGKLIEVRTCKRAYTNNAEDKAAMGHDLVDDKKYSDQLSEVVKRGNRHAFFDKKIWTGPIKEGYAYLNDDINMTRSIIIDPVRFQLIRKAVELILHGTHAPREALDILNNQWHYKSIKRRTRGGGKLSRATWYRLLSDSFYYGLMVRRMGEVRGNYQPLMTEKEFDLLQVRLGKMGKPRVTHHHYPYKGILKCGECGGAVTCQEKQQLICDGCKAKFALAKGRVACPHCGTKILEMKNPKYLNYIYYHCTHKTHPDCSQGTVEKKVIEKQIDQELSRYEIPVEFKDWAIDHLKEVTDDESQTQNQVRDNLFAKFKTVDLKIQNLVRSRIAIDPSQTDLLSYYDKEQTALFKEKQDLEAQIANYNDHQQDWVELTKQTFEFACYARYWFANSDIDTKTAILHTLGENITLKDGKLLIQEHKPFFLIEKAKAEIQEVLEKIEPEKRIGDPIQILSLEPISTLMRRRRDSNS